MVNSGKVASTQGHFHITWNYAICMPLGMSSYWTLDTLTYHSQVCKTTLDMHVACINSSLAEGLLQAVCSDALEAQQL